MGMSADHVCDNCFLNEAHLDKVAQNSYFLEDLGIFISDLLISD